ncbi:MAG TPA: hypothetical protein VEY67_09200, partial [Candidatus Dormibacteraeota bacterium]|nr:hypothetical protein [Candidatus Dormibacteraeota bacterium]
VVAVVVGQALRLSVPAGGPAGSPAPSPEASFDPSLVGPGVAPAAEVGGYWALVLIGAGFLALWAVAHRGRRRLITLVPAAVLLGWALIGSFDPVSVSPFFTAPGLNVARAEMPPGVSLEQFYVIAAPRTPFSIGLGVQASAGLLPVRLEGIVGASDVVTAGPIWTAVWLDAEKNGGSSGPATPFTPFGIDGWAQSLWLVGRAGPCALGPSFDQHSTASAGYASMVPILRLSVLGWPRTVALTEPVVVEPRADACVPATPSPSESPSPTR